MNTDKIEKIGVNRRPSASKSRLPALKTFFNRQWWWTTLLVLAGMAVLARLGVWQLDRREQRRAYNAEIRAQLAQPPLDLATETLTADLSALKNRQARARGEYDLARQVVLTNQLWNNSPGFHLLTPLLIQGGSKAVLVDRGWLPAAQQSAGDWSAYDVSGAVEVNGYIKLSQSLPGDSTPTGPALEWYRVDVTAIQAQLPYELLPVYIQQAPLSGAEPALPFKAALDVDLSEGNHLSYAIQWFIFATILGISYVHVVKQRA
jgi:surfeit locus 1 family protein